MNFFQIEEIASKIQQVIFKSANNASLGHFKSQFRGSGLQFREHQIYEHGDDIRFIDWKLSAKMSRPYIKTFEEERNIELAVVIDLSPSLMMGYHQKSKLEAALEILYLFAFWAAKSKDKVKLILLGKPKLETQAKSGKELIVQVLMSLEKLGMLNSNGSIRRDFIVETVPLEQKLATLKRLIAAKKEVMFISDNYETSWSDLNFFMGRKTFHPVQLFIPLDRAKVIPYSFLSKNRNQTLFQYNAYFQQKENIDKKQKIIHCHLEENYLEKFIKQL